MSGASADAYTPRRRPRWRNRQTRRIQNPLSAQAGEGQESAAATPQGPISNLPAQEPAERLGAPLGVSASLAAAESAPTEATADPALAALAARWPTLPGELRQAILRVAGIQETVP